MGILDSLIGGIFGIGATAMTNNANRKAQDAQNRFNANQAQLDRDFQSAEAEIARDWQEKFYTQYQSPEAMVRQYEAAGLNPAMMYVGSGPSSGSVPSTSTPQGAQATASQTFFADATALIESVLKLDSIKSQISKTESETNLNEDLAAKARAEAEGANIENQFKPDLLRQDLEQGQVNIDNMRAGIDLVQSQINLNNIQSQLSVEQSKKIVAETDKILIEQATERLKQSNLEKSTEHLAAQIKLIEAERTLKVAQETLTLSQDKVTNEDYLAKQFQNLYRKYYNAEPPKSSWSELLSNLRSIRDDKKGGFLWKFVKE